MLRRWGTRGRRREVGFNYVWNDWKDRRFPGEPHDKNPHMIAKQRIEKLRELLALERELGE